MPVAWDDFEPVDQPKQASVDWSSFEPVTPPAEEKKPTAQFPAFPPIPTYQKPAESFKPPEEAMLEPSIASTFTTPIVNWKPYEVKKEDHPLTALGKEAANIAVGIPEFFTSPIGAAAPFAAEVAPITTGLSFTGTMLYDLGRGIKDTIKGWADMSSGQKAAALLDLGANGLMTLAAGAGTKIAAEKRLFAPKEGVTTAPEVKAWAASFGLGDVEPVTDIRKPQAVVRPTQPYVAPESGPMGTIPPLEQPTTERTPNAIPERSPTPVNVGQAPEDRQTMGEGVPVEQPQPAVPQTQERPTPAAPPPDEGIAPTAAPEAATGGVQTLIERAMELVRTRELSDQDRMSLGSQIEAARQGDWAGLSSELIRLSEAPQKKQKVARGVTILSRFNKETESSGPDILSWISENMRLLSRNGARQAWGKDRYEQNKSLWDDVPGDLPMLHSTSIYSLRGRGPDVVAQAAFDSGVLKEPSVNALWQAIDQASKKRRGGKGQADVEAKWIAGEEKQLTDWEAATKKAADKNIEVTTEDVAPGDMLELEGERVKVKSHNEETGDVELEDGRKFGTQVLKEGQKIYVEKFEPTEGSAEFSPPQEKPAAPPALRPGEKAGELFQGADQPFNLAGETSVDSDRIAQDKAAAEQRAKEAADAAAKQQLELSGESAGVKPEAASQGGSAATEETPRPTSKFGGTAPVGARVDNYIKGDNGRWYRVNEQGERMKLPPVNAKKHADLEARHGEPPPPAETRSQEEILSQAAQVRVKIPEGATVIRVTDSKGRKSEVFIADANRGENIFRGVDVANIEAGTIGKDRKFKKVDGDVAVSEAKPLRAIAGEGAGAMPVADIEFQIRKNYGIEPGSKIRVVNQPDADWSAQAHLEITRESTRKPDGSFTRQLSYIEVNSPKIDSPALLDWAVEHEFSHSASEVIGPILRALTTEEFAAIAKEVEDRGYPSGEHLEEWKARGIQTLAQTWKGRNWFEKAVGTILSWANKLGFPLTRLSAERIASKGIADAISIAKKESGPTVAPTQETVLRALARTPEQYQRQETFEEAARAVRVIASYSDLARTKLAAADAIGLSERAKRLLELPRAMEMTALGMVGDNHSIETYAQAREWAKNQTPFIRWNVTRDALHSLGYEERRSLAIQQGYQLRRTRIESPGFQNKILTLLKRDNVAEIQNEKDLTFRNVISVKIQEILNQMQAAKADAAKMEVLQQDLKQARGLQNESLAVAQHMDDIVSTLYPNYWEFNRPSKSGQVFSDLFFAAKRGAGDPVTNARDVALYRLAGEVLGINSSLSEKLYWLEATKREPDFAPLIESTSKAFADRLQENPGAAIKEIIQKTAKQATKAERARAAFQSLNAKVLRELTDFADYEGAVQADERIKRSAEWRELVNSVNSDAGAVGIPRVMREEIRQGLYNTFSGKLSEKDPFGVTHDITLGNTKEEAVSAQGKIEAYLTRIQDWLNDPGNVDHPDRTFWERQHDFIDNVYNSMGVLAPGAVKSFGSKFFRRSWTIPEFLLRQVKLPALKVMQTAFENWHRASVVSQQWSSAKAQPLMSLIIQAMKRQKLPVALGIDRYREEVFNSLAWAYRHNKALKAGDKVFGRTVTESDLAVLRYMGNATNELMNKARNVGAEGVMPKEMVFDQWANNAFAIRLPQEFGAEPGTTVPRELSHTRGFSLAQKLSDPRVAGDRRKEASILNLKEYFEPYVMRWLGERSADYSEATPFESLFRDLVQKFNDKEPDAPRSLQDIIDYINANSDEGHDEAAIADIVVGGMAREAQKMWKKFFEPDKASKEAQIRVLRASRETPFTTAFEKDQGSSFWYDYGMMTSAEVRSTAIDSTMFHMTRLDIALKASIQSLQEALTDYPAAKKDPASRREFLKKHGDLFKSGDDFRDFEDLEMQLHEIKAFHDRLPTFAGQGVVRYEGMTTLYRLVSDNVLQTLSGLMTMARVFTGSVIKQGLALSAFERFSAISYPKAALSMLMSVSKLATLGPAQMVGRRLGLVKPLNDNLSGWAEELFRTNKFFDQQYAYGLGFKNATLDTIRNNLQMPYTHGGGYSVQLSSNRGLALLQKGAFRALSAVEAPIEAIKTIFPTLGYAAAYDSVARQVYWSVRGIESRARRTFDTYEKLGQLGRFDFSRPKAVQNKLTPKELFGDGILPATQTQMDLTREFFRRGTDGDLNDFVIRFWSKLAETPKEQRGNVHMLSADAATPADALKLETARAGALASIGLFDIHHASPINRAWILRSNDFGRLAWPVAGWSMQSTRQWFALMGKAAGDPRLRPWALTMLTGMGILGVLGIQTIGGDIERRIFSWIKWLAFNEVDPVKHLGEGKDAQENARIAAAETFSYIPALGNMVELATNDRGDRKAQIESMFLVDKIKSAMNYVNGVAHTGDPMFGLANFAKRDAPWMRPLLNRTPGQEGLVNEKNVRTVIQKFAPDELLRAPAGGYGMPTPTPLTAIKTDLANAIYRGDAKGVTEKYYEFIEKATEMGRPDPEKLAQTVVRSLNPYSLALTGHPSEAQRADILSRASDREKQILLDGETQYLAASQMLGIDSEMVKKEPGTGAGRVAAAGGGTAGVGIPSLRGSGGGLSRVGTGLRRISLNAPRLRLPRLPGGGASRGGSRPKRLSLPKARSRKLVSGRLSARSGGRGSTRKPRKRKLSLA